MKFIIVNEKFQLLLFISCQHQSTGNLNRLFPLPRHVWVPWSPLSTNPWLGFQPVLTCSCNHTLHPCCPSSGPFHPTKPKCPPANHFAGYWRKPSQRTRSLPFADNNQLLQNPNSYTELFTLPVHHFQDLLFLSCLSGRKVFLSMPTW